MGSPRARVDVIRDSEINDLIDYDTRDMLSVLGGDFRDASVRHHATSPSNGATVERTDDLDTHWLRWLPMLNTLAT